MSERESRISDYKSFRDNCEGLFKEIAKSDKSHSRLDSLFRLNICPKGRFGGINENEIEVFYGNRPIGSRTTIGNNLQRQTTLEIAHGSMLSYRLTDDGHIICALYPAESENQRQIEDFILLEYIKEPCELKHKYKNHWRMFVSYMEGTCIDGEPDCFQRLQVFYLKNFKPYSVNSRIQSRKVVSLAKEVGKYVLTIGLSGFLILAFTLAKDKVDSIDKEKTLSKQRKFIEISIKSIDEHFKAIVKNTSHIEEMSSGISSIAESTEGINATLKDIDLNLETLKSQIKDIEERL